LGEEGFGFRVTCQGRDDFRGKLWHSVRPYGYKKGVKKFITNQ
jgi:hypothetical protein